MLGHGGSCNHIDNRRQYLVEIAIERKERQRAVMLRCSRLHPCAMIVEMLGYGIAIHVGSAFTQHGTYEVGNGGIGRCVSSAIEKEVQATNLLVAFVNDVEFRAVGQSLYLRHGHGEFSKALDGRLLCAVEFHNQGNKAMARAISSGVSIPMVSCVVMATLMR